MTLSLDGRRLPWARWDREFAEHMPNAISALQQALMDDISGGRAARGIRALGARAGVLTEMLRQWCELTLVEAIDMARRLAADDGELRLLTSS